MTAGPPTRLATADGTVEVLDLPAAPDATDRAPLVLLHEGLGSLGLWRGWPQRLHEATGRRTVVPTRLGHGRSDPEPGVRGHGYHHLEAERRLPAVLAALAVDRPVLVGHSDGATIALLAAAGPVEATAVVALAPHVFVDERCRTGLRDAVDAYEHRGLRAKLAAHHDDVDATFRAWSEVWTDPAFVAGWDVTDRLVPLEAPCLLVQGTDDPYGTLEQLDRIAGAVAGPVTRCILDGVGHAPHLEAADDTTTAVLAHLDRHA